MSLSWGRVASRSGMIFRHVPVAPAPHWLADQRLRFASGSRSGESSPPSATFGIERQASSASIIGRPQAVLDSSAAAMVGMESTSDSRHAANRRGVAPGGLSLVLEMAFSS